MEPQTAVFAIFSIVLAITTMFFMAFAFASWEKLRELQKNRKLITKKGIYTFTPHKEVE